MRYFAVKVGDYIQVRAAKEKPKLARSAITLKNGRRLTLSVYVGGDVVGVAPADSLYLPQLQGKRIFELTKENTDYILAKGIRLS
jgi:hypothetical protein